MSYQEYVIALNFLKACIGDFKDFDDYFLTIFENPSYDTDAHCLLKNLKNSLDVDDINLLSKVRAVTSDNGPNVVKMKQLLKGFFLDMDHIVLETSCFLHDQNLLCKAIDTLRCMDVVTALLTFLTSSFKRVDHLRDELIKVDKHYEGVLKFAITRWLSRSQAIDRLIDCLDAIEKLLEKELEPVDENSLTIEKLRELDPQIADLFVELNVTLPPVKPLEMEEEKSSDNENKEEQPDVNANKEEEIISELIDLKKDQEEKNETN